MKPVLLSFELAGRSIALPSYGLFVALGLAAGIVLAARQARRVGLDVAAVLDLAFWILVSGVLGSRLAFVLLHLGDFARLCGGTGIGRRDCTAALRIWDGGLVFYGGALAAAGVVVWFSRRRGWRLGQVADLFAPGLALGHAIGRLGCFLAGCCFGKACPPGSAVGVSFPPGSVAHAELAAAGTITPGGTTPPLHPTQLYEAAGELAIFFLLLAVRRRQPSHGALTLLYVGAYALLRAIIEVFRGDVSRRFLVEVAVPSVARALGLPAGQPVALSTSQALSLVLLGAVLGGAWISRRKTTRRPATR